MIPPIFNHYFLKDVVFISMPIIMQTLNSFFFSLPWAPWVCAGDWESDRQIGRQLWSREPTLWEVFEASTPGQTQIMA